MRHAAHGDAVGWQRGAVDALQTPRRPQRAVPTVIMAPRPAAITVHRSSAGRRWLGVFAWLVLTVVSLPVHVFALFFVYVEFASPGDQASAITLVACAFLASFVTLLITGTLSQLIGGFPGRWRARVSFAAFSAVVAVAVMTVAALTYF